MSTPLSLPRLAAAALLACLVLAVAPADAAEPACRPCADLSGRWSDGSWTSATTGHKGELRATLTRCGADRYRCTFCGTFFGVVPFRYSVPLHVTGCDETGRVYFRASKTLPLGMGTFHCAGSATRCSFRADFSSSKGDRGVFVLTR